MKKNKRPQRPKTENKEWMRAKNEHLRSSVADPHRNKYRGRNDRNEWRKKRQSGMVDA